MTKGVGTLGYGAPELFDVGDEEEEEIKYDNRVDVFSAGSTWFPFKQTFRVEMLKHQVATQAAKIVELESTWVKIYMKTKSNKK